MSINWLEAMGHDVMEDRRRRSVMPVFPGQKLVVVGGSSGMGRQTAADVSYSAAKGALHALTHNLALELAPLGRTRLSAEGNLGHRL